MSPPVGDKKQRVVFRLCSLPGCRHDLAQTLHAWHLDDDVPPQPCSTSASTVAVCSSSVPFFGDRAAGSSRGGFDGARVCVESLVASPAATDPNALSHPQTCATLSFPWNSSVQYWKSFHESFDSGPPAFERSGLRPFSYVTWRPKQGLLASP